MNSARFFSILELLTRVAFGLTGVVMLIACYEAFWWGSHFRTYAAPNTVLEIGLGVALVLFGLTFLGLALLFRRFIQKQVWLIYLIIALWTLSVSVGLFFAWSMVTKEETVGLAILTVAGPIVLALFTWVLAKKSSAQRTDRGEW